MVVGKLYPYGMMSLGIMQLVISVLVLISSIFITLFIGFIYGLAPILIGICFAFAGILAVLLSKYKKDGLVTAVVIMSVISSFLAAGLFIGLMVMIARLESVYDTISCEDSCQDTKGPAYGIISFVISMTSLECGVAIQATSLSCGWYFYDTHDQVTNETEEEDAMLP